MKNQDNEKEAWARIDAVAKVAGMNTNFFAKYIGLPCGENLYQIKRGNNSISLNVANLVCEKFPAVNKLWLLNGEGKMLTNGSEILSGRQDTPCETVMSRRDIFVAMAMSGLLAGGRFSDVGKSAVAHADETLALLPEEETMTTNR